MNIDNDAPVAIQRSTGMSRSTRWLSLGLVVAGLALAGCQQQNSTETAQKDKTGSENATEAPSDAANDATAADATDSKDADPSKVSPLAARALIKHYYDDINQGDYKAAYALWAGGSKDSKNASGKTFEDFKAGFKNTKKSEVDIATPGSIEGAAGSSYIEIPVTIHATTNDGKTQDFKGSYTLRRVNNVDGASWAEKNWHIYSADIQSGE